MSILNKLFIKSGIVEFSTGDHEILIKTDSHKEEKMWIQIVGNPGNSCGSINKDYFTTKRVKDGYIIYAKIESNKRKVKFIIDKNFNRSDIYRFFKMIIFILGSIILSLIFLY